jgi:Undecaprenyl-phosphate glucose phosphotransferase
MALQEAIVAIDSDGAVPRQGMGDRARQMALAIRERTIAPSLAVGIATTFEVAALFLVSLLASYLWLGVNVAASPDVAGPLFGAPIVAMLALRATGVYELDALRRHQTRIRRTFMTWTVVFGGFAIFATFGDTTPAVRPSWYGVWYLVGLGTFAFTSALIATAVRRQSRAGRLQRRAVIVGGGAAAENLIQALEAHGGNEVRILGIFDDRDDQRSPDSLAGYPKLGTVPDLVEFARVASVDLLIVSIPTTAETRLLQLLKQLWVLPVDIRLAAHANKLRLRPRSYSYIGRVPFLDVFDRPIAGWHSVVKRVFDLAFATLALVLLTPVMLLTALAIRLDSPGPILFRQKRYGFNNEVIEILKFRTLRHESSDPAARRPVTRNDDRVTRVGRFLRRTSLDELPQFFNVLRGDLSLVGPRPHAVGAHTGQRLWEEVVDGYFARHKVKPGVTGWAQINGWRGEVDNKDKIQGRVEHDLHYIENWSVLFDLYILLLTPFRIIHQDGAY